MLFDSSAEISIIVTTFARKLGYVIDESRTQEYVGMVENTYMAVRPIQIKVTSDGSLVSFFDIWVGDQSKQEAILGKYLWSLQ